MLVFEKIKQRKFGGKTKFSRFFLIFYGCFGEYSKSYKIKSEFKTVIKFSVSTSYYV